MTWEYIDDHMTMDRLKAMQSYWDANPPLHLLVKAYIGYEKPSKPQGIEEFLAMTGIHNGQ
jgi:hypothetical protein